MDTIPFLFIFFYPKLHCDNERKHKPRMKQLYSQKPVQENEEFVFPFLTFSLHPELLLPALEIKLNYYKAENNN